MLSFPVVKKRFRFFEMAKWMAAEKAKENYQMTPSGAIRVGKPGIYIIHANVSMIVLRKNHLKQIVLRDCSLSAQTVLRQALVACLIVGQGDTTNSLALKLC